MAEEPHPEHRCRSLFMGLEQLLERDLLGCQGNILCPSKDSCSLGQQSPTFLASGTSFMEDNFSTDGDGVGGAQAVM